MFPAFLLCSMLSVFSSAAVAQNVAITPDANGGWSLTVAGEYQIAHGRYWFPQPIEVPGGSWGSAVAILTNQGYQIIAYGLTDAGATMLIWSGHDGRTVVATVSKVPVLGWQRSVTAMLQPESPPPTHRWQLDVIHVGAVDLVAYK